jgi:hypothetical protein
MENTKREPVVIFLSNSFSSFSFGEQAKEREQQKNPYKGGVRYS